MRDTEARPLRSESALLQLDDVSKRYILRDGREHVAVQGVSFEVPSGEFVSIIGRSGCGKSTVLKLVGGLLEPTSGRIALRDTPIKGPSPGVGIVFQQPVLLPWYTVAENVILPVRLHGRRRAHRSKTSKEKIARYLELVGLPPDTRDRYPKELSGGMQQRVAIVRALIEDPSLLLMDEPFGALDAFTRERMNEELQRIWMEERKSVLFVTHDVDEAIFLSDRVLIMATDPGRVVADVRVSFERPRKLGIADSQEFRGIRRTLRQHLEG